MIFLGFLLILPLCCPAVFLPHSQPQSTPVSPLIQRGYQYIRTKLYPKKLISMREIDGIITINLVMSGIQAGASIPKTLLALSQAIGEPRYQHTANALLQGIPWQQAWDLAPSDKISRILSQILAPAWENGVNPSNILKAAAAELREKKLQRTRQATEKLSVKLILPLGLCYLPAFILLGISPLIISGFSGL